MITSAESIATALKLERRSKTRTPTTEPEDARTGATEVNVDAQFPDVHVEAVRTMIVRGRLRRMGRGHAKTKNWKKAIVTLRAGEKIEFFEAF